MISTTKHAGFTIPGYAYPNNWTQTVGTSIPGQIASIGGNWAVLQTSYSVASITSTAITSTASGSYQGAVPDAGITAMVQAVKAAGLNVCLKPHVLPTTDIQDHLIPGAFLAQNTAHYTAGQNTLNIGGANFDSTWLNRRVITPTNGHYGEIPSGLNTLGTATPTWTTITGITDSTQVTMSTTATASSSTGYVVIPDDTAVQTWFSNYTTIIDHLLSVATAAGGVDMLDLSTEHDFMTLIYDGLWRTLITHVRSNYPNLKITMGMAAGAGYGSVLCWDALDYIGITFYKDVQAVAGTEDYATIQTTWQTHVSSLAALSAAWNNKQIIFTEIGYRSIVASGYHPYQTGQTVVVDQSAQWACTQAFLHTLWNQPWFAGFHWWTWAHPQTGNSEANSYSPNGKAVETAFSQWFGAVPSRFVTNGTVNSRR